MSSLVGSSPIRINSVRRLIKGIAEVDLRPLMHTQVRAIQDRLNSGKDSDGRAFAPYKTVRKSNHARPLIHAARLFQEAQFTQENDLTGGSQTEASITGLAARIARNQNYRRTFLAYSRDDRREIRKGFITTLKDSILHGSE